VLKTKTSRNRKVTKRDTLTVSEQASHGRGGDSTITENLLRRVDPSDLKADYDLWPPLALKAWSETQVPTFTSDRFNRVAFAGLGGSSLTGELLVDLSRERKSEIAFETLKDYHIPNSFGEKTLVIGMSSSGATEETLSILSEAHKKGLTAYSFGSGGPIESFSRDRWGFQFIRTAMLKVPRSSLPGIFYPVLKFLVWNKLLEVSDDEVNESIQVMNVVRDDFVSALDEERNRSIRLGRALTRDETGFTLVYSSNRTRAVGLRARQSINENAKMHAFNGEIPELCHNEIVGWDYRASLVDDASQIRRNGDSAALLLRLNEDDPPEVKTRFEIIQDIVGKARGKTLEAPYVGTSYLARIMSMLYFLDYASYYMAIFRKVDPMKTPSIDMLKRELAKRLNYVEKL
jgi:glucose/mannose-6-phosphate isomerase